MSAPRLRRALVASTLLHVAVLAGLLALAHPRFRNAPTLRVALVGQAGTAAGPEKTETTAGGTPRGGATTERAAPVAVERAAPVTAERPAPVADPGAAGPSRPPPSRSPGPPSQ